MFEGKYKAALRVAFVYLLFSSIWIFTSDTLLTLFIQNVEEFRNISYIKGTLFVIISSIIVYYLIKHEINLMDQAQKDIEILENYDSLTKLYNRKKYRDKLELYKNNNKEYSIILTDINGLRIYNEAFSYSSGDEILVSYAKILSRLFESAFIARIGGDEFVIVFNYITNDEILRKMSIIQDKITDFSYKGIPIDVSLGFASSTEIDGDINLINSLAEKRMNRDKLLKENSSSNTLIASLLTTLFERSDETELHAKRMEAMCKQIGEHIGLSNVQINDLMLLALLHDIGKIGINDAILKKPDKLTEQEMNEMKKHPAIGFRIASTIPQLEAISYDILTHHEWYNGEGYPKKLKGEDIPLNARILSIVDAFDAMTNDRVYRKKISEEEAIEEIKNFKGIQFDPKLVDDFIELFSK